MSVQKLVNFLKWLGWCGVAGFILFIGVGYWGYVFQSSLVENELIAFGGIVSVVFLGLCKFLTKHCPLCGRIMSVGAGIVLALLLVLSIGGCVNREPTTIQAPELGKNSEYPQSDRIEQWIRANNKVPDFDASASVGLSLNFLFAQPLVSALHKPQVRVTRYDFLVDGVPASQGYGLYSYLVLLDIHPEKDQKAKAVLDSILKQESTKSYGTSDAKKREQNLLLLMLRHKPNDLSADSILKNYSRERSVKVLNQVRLLKSHLLAASSKISVITTAKPIEQVVEGDPILETNFSKIPHDKIDFYFEAYLATVLREDFTDRDKLIEAEVAFFNLLRSASLSWKAIAKISEIHKAFANE